MNEEKLKKLIAAARREAPPAPPADFAADLLRAVRREPPAAPPAPATIFDQLSGWFPRLALAAAVIIILCLAADFALSSAGLPDLGDGAAQMTSQLDLNDDGL